MPKSIHLAIGSTMSKPGDVQGNLQQVDQFAQRAEQDGVQLLLTPELSISGYGGYPEVLATAEPAGEGPIYDGLAAIARRAQLVLCAGFVEQSGPKRYLAHYVVYPDGEFCVQRKHRVTPVERPLDPVRPLHAEPGDELGQPDDHQLSYFDVAGFRCVLLICADMGLKDIWQELGAANVDVLLVPTGAGGQREDYVTTDELTTAAGREQYQRKLATVFPPGGDSIIGCLQYGIALAAVNQCGYDGRLHYHAGHGMIITPMGEVPGFFHGLPNLDRQRPMYAHAVINMEERVPMQYAESGSSL